MVNKMQLFTEQESQAKNKTIKVEFLDVCPIIAYMKHVDAGSRSPAL